MQSSSKLIRTIILTAVSLCAGLLPIVGHSHENRHGGRGDQGAVYTMSNAAEGNAILIYTRSTNGQLTPAGSVPTGGMGSGGGLGNQGGLVLSEDQRWLFAVNAGSDDISVFAVKRDGLKKMATVPSGGDQPISVPVDDDLIYVLNAGSETITGFKLNDSGMPEPLQNSTRSLSGKGVGPAQIGFSPDGRQLVITEKAANAIVTYEIDRDGMPAAQPEVTQSQGQTPFGFTFSRRNQLLVTEAAGGADKASSVSSYRLSRDGMLNVLDSAVPTQQTAACWIEVSPNGRYAYTTNTGSATLTGFRVSGNGMLKTLDSQGNSAATGDGPIDLTFAGEGQFLYSLNARSHSISAFRVMADGSLQALRTTDGIPVGANGLTAR